MEPLKVQDQSPEVAEMAKNWPITAALIGGTPAMRAAAATYLPKWPAEDDESYGTRLKVATLYPAFKRTLAVMTGKPFSKQMTLGDDTPERIKKYAEDINLEGQNLHAFSADLLLECLGFGLCGVLVDYPTITGIRTLAEEKKVNARPYFVKVAHDRILGWKAQRVNGVMQLTQLRLAEARLADDGPYGVVAVPQVRVLRPGAWEIWELNPVTKQYDILAGNGLTSIKVIPFVPFYGVRTGFMTGISPFLDLAHLNVKHWQSQSDQDTILHVARVPILTVAGAETDTVIAVGGASMIKLPMGAVMTFVEHTGQAIGAGNTALYALEDQMVQTGAEILVNKALGGDKTATESTSEGEGNKCDLLRITETFEDSMDQALQMAALWIGEESGGHATLFKEFGAGTITEASSALITSLQQAGLISKRRAFIEQQRRGVLDASLDPQEELDEAEEDGPPLGSDPLAKPPAKKPVVK